MSAAACSRRPRKRGPAIDIDTALAGAGYEQRGRMWTCPICVKNGHTSPIVSIKRKDADYYCHRCKLGGHIRILAEAQGRRLER
jgi:hypothetical protein